MKNTKPDTLTQQIGVLVRREVEARILIPVIEALGNVFGREDVVRVIGDAIVEIARGQGAELAQAMGGNTLDHFMQSLQFWSQDNALELDVLKNDSHNLHFNVTRCRYAEMYKDLGIPELGCLLSCNRDYALIEGFNTGIELARTQTLMEGAPHCDFRYTAKRV
ncbi:MAG: L-2-amino-thiazoline-4-carboxylic acid hydrolase [Thermodesulfobacteriota bacterium]